MVGAEVELGTALANQYAVGGHDLDDLRVALLAERRPQDRQHGGLLRGAEGVHPQPGALEQLVGLVGPLPAVRGRALAGDRRPLRGVERAQEGLGAPTTDSAAAGDVTVG